MAAERAAMAEQLRAARGQYTAQKALFDSEMRKYRAALSLAAQHTEWWKAESRRIERDAAEKRDALESWHAKQMSSKVESERKGAQARSSASSRPSAPPTRLRWNPRWRRRLASATRFRR